VWGGGEPTAQRYLGKAVGVEQGFEDSFKEWVVVREAEGWGRRVEKVSL